MTKKKKPVVKKPEAKSEAYEDGGCGPVPPGPFKVPRFDTPAFPRALTGRDPVGQAGMSLRDYFASHALQGMLSYSHVGINGNYHENCSCAGVAESAYQYADAMLVARK